MLFRSIHRVVLSLFVLSLLSIVHQVVYIPRASKTQPAPFLFPVCVPHALRPNNISYLSLLINSLHLPPRRLFVVSVDGKCISPWCHALPRTRKHLAECENTEHIECIVQQAAYDVVATLRYCRDTFPDHEWLLVMEDDMTACDGKAIREIESVLTNEPNNQTAVYFFSVAFTSFVIRANVVDAFGDAVFSRLTQQPFDIVLWGDAWLPVGMHRKQYNQTLFHHEGKVSNMAFRNEKEFMEQYNQNGDFSTSHIRVIPVPTIKKVVNHSVCEALFTQNIPYNSEGKIKAHHWDAQTGKWNENDRWLPMSLPLSDQGIVMYIGGNERGEDGKQLLRLFPSIQLYVYEPVPSFVQTLRQQSEFHSSIIKSIGLGSSNRIVYLPMSEMLGQSTFVMASSEENTSHFSVEIHIRSAAEEILELLHQYQIHSIDLVHMNCEGCEWEFMESITQANLWRNISLFQLSTHYYPSHVPVNEFRGRYCTQHMALLETHDLCFGPPFGWQRWKIRERF